MSRTVQSWSNPAVFGEQVSTNRGVESDVFSVFGTNLSMIPSKRCQLCCSKNRARADRSLHRDLYLIGLKCPRVVAIFIEDMYVTDDRVCPRTTQVVLSV